MERRELYDPEDIESLLSERSFDELLEEERAYVLRHLSGREEYEAMRSLLLDLRDTERDAEPLEPDAGVRDRVLQVFRDQQQPRWRVWLNSVGPLVMPRDLTNLWRPALAFGTLAVLVVVGIWVVNTTGGKKNAELAEVRRPEPPAQASEANTGALSELDSAPSEPFRTLTEGNQAPELMAPVAVQEEAAVAEIQEDLNEPAADLDLAAGATTTADAVAEKREQETTKAAAAEQADMVMMYEQETSRTIGTRELSQNQSLANTEVKVVAAKERKRVAEPTRTGRDLGQDQALLGLLAAGW
jgi:hypothetical protein